ncbi:hypothetical protein ACIBMX_47080 [Streptomyces phaeochromogenes]|uniref:hypothetical protein n=1 Tax=Streptomyces phaeochromogenes TaxID=1923 RepID=UPI0033F30D48
MLLGPLEGALGHVHGLGREPAHQSLHGHGGQHIAAQLHVTDRAGEAEGLDEVPLGRLLVADVESCPPGEAGQLGRDREELTADLVREAALQQRGGTVVEAVGDGVGLPVPAAVFGVPAAGIASGLAQFVEVCAADLLASVAFGGLVGRGDEPSGDGDGEGGGGEAGPGLGIAGPDGSPALTAAVMLVLPTPTQSTAVACADVLIENPTAWAAAPGTGRDTRLTLHDVQAVLENAWETAAEQLPDTVGDTAQLPWAAPPTTELRITCEQPAANGVPPALDTLVDLAPFGTADRGPRPQMAVTVTAEPAAGRTERKRLLREALVYMAREFGYVDAEVDLL